MTTPATHAERRRMWLRAALGALSVTALWIALAAWRPDTTFHLAPAVLAWVVPYLIAIAGATTRATVVAAVVGGAVAAGVSVGLAATGLLGGPALVGGGPLAESLLVSAAATVIAVVVAALLLPGAVRRRGAGGS